MTLKETDDTNKYVVGNRPVHVHRDRDGGQWNCNSPYCNSMDVDPPHKGGPPVIIEGQEPWRGR